MTRLAGADLGQIPERGAVITGTEIGATVRTVKDTAVVAGKIIVSMVKEIEVGTGIIAADINPLHLLHLPRVVGHLRDHLMIGEEIGIVVEVIPDVEEEMTEGEGNAGEPQLMSILTSRGVSRKRAKPCLTPVSLSGFGTVSNGLFVLHNRYRLPRCKSVISIKVL